jgi:hypothetical protein
MVHGEDHGARNAAGAANSLEDTMDKRTFIKEAPAFYALAVAVSMIENRHREVFTEGQLANIPHEVGEIPTRLSFQHPEVLAAGLSILTGAGVVEMATEAFGPTLYRRTPELTEEWLFGEGGAQIPIFRRYAQIQNLRWLSSALEDVNRRYLELDMSQLDFDEPVGDPWEPLPLDRTDEALTEATAKVDEAITQIQADNGYAANVPGERDYVVQSLTSFSTTLKESAQITGMQIKTFALDPLNAVIKRFKGAGLELVAAAAKDAILSWLKVKFGALITWLLF